MADYNKIISEQAKHMGLSSAVPVIEEDNGFASTDGKAVYVNPGFMSKVESSAGEGGVRFVIGHELGHIAAGMGGGHGAELDADQFAARSVAAAGFDRKAIEGVMTHLPSDSSDTHPGSSTREAVAMKAFNTERVQIEEDDGSSKKKKIKREGER